MEAKDIVISIVVPLVVAVMSYFGSRRGTKVSREEFENRKEATPPELLRLEKWSTILKDSSDYPERIKYELDVDTIQSTYNDILKRATLENKVVKLGILSAEVRENLISIKPSAGGIHYPKPSWDKAVLKNWAISISITIGFLVNFIILGFGVVSGRIPFWVFIIFLQVLYSHGLRFIAQKSLIKYRKILYFEMATMLSEIFIYLTLILIWTKTVKRRRKEVNLRKGRPMIFGTQESRKTILRGVAGTMG